MSIDQLRLQFSAWDLRVISGASLRHTISALYEEIRDAIVYSDRLVLDYDEQIWWKRLFTLF